MAVDSQELVANKELDGAVNRYDERLKSYNELRNLKIETYTMNGGGALEAVADGESRCLKRSEN